MNNKSDARVLAEAALAAATECRSVEQRIDVSIARARPQQVIVTPRSDGEKYRWIRGNRGNYAISDAIAHSDRDSDFDDRIDAAMDQAERCADAAPEPVPTKPGAPMHLRPPKVGAVADPARRVPAPPATCTGPAVVGRFDEAADTVRFCVWIDGVMVDASVGAAVLRSHYGHESSPTTLFMEHSSALLEAVRDRIAGGSIEPIVLHEYDLN